MATSTCVHFLVQQPLPTYAHSDGKRSWSDVERPLRNKHSCGMSSASKDQHGQPILIDSSLAYFQQHHEQRLRVHHVFGDAAAGIRGHIQLRHDDMITDRKRFKGGLTDDKLLMSYRDAKTAGTAVHELHDHTITLGQYMVRQCEAWCMSEYLGMLTSGYNCPKHGYELHMTTRRWTMLPGETTPWPSSNKADSMTDGAMADVHDAGTRVDLDIAMQHLWKFDLRCANNRACYY